MTIPNRILFRHHELFKFLDEKQLQKIETCAKKRVFRRGEYLFFQEDEAKHFYLVCQGCVSLNFRADNGEERVIELVSAGGTFAEALMFLQASYYPVSAKAEKDTEIIQFNSDTYRKTITKSSECCLKMLGHLSRRIHQLLIEANEYTMLTSRQRFISYLIELQQQQQNLTIHLPASRQTIASHLYMKPETLSRTMLQLNRDGLIECNQQYLKIIDLHKLQQAKIVV
ncbi:Crp/Fnr family transcriptional regulator [Ectothiorhodospiraceae bacterium BW-2]|nr:Crp/Fnr family transcriptional regulator [Ectothiorhodospiraceae bacterium BW-2]